MRSSSSLVFLLLPTAALLTSCAGGRQCEIHSDCRAGFHCESGVCRQDCREDFDCASGETCSVIGRCVSPDAGVEDAGRRPDAGSTPDAFVPRSDGGSTSTDAGPVDVDAGTTSTDAGATTDAGAPLDDGGLDAGPPSGPVARGTYRYTRLPQSLGNSQRVRFHPDGSYAVILESYDVVQVYDWATRTMQRVNLDPPGSAHVYFHDLAFDPSGAFALIVGADVDGGTETGVIYRMDDAMVRAGSASAAFTRLGETRAGERFAAIEYPLPPRTGSPIVMSSTRSSPYIVRLRELDPATGAFAGLVTASPTSAGCDDMAFADNELGGWGVAVVCGLNGGDAPYYTEIGGVPEWRPDGTSFGNVSRVASHPSGQYALAIGWSGWGRIHRFESGAWNPSGSSPAWTTRGLWSVAFQQDGARALVVGAVRGSPPTAAILEYRHDLWSTADVTDVSIAGFDAAPYLGTSSDQLNDAAFRPGCDGGLIVGGHSDFSGSDGMLIEFRIEGLRSCGGVL